MERKKFIKTFSLGLMGAYAIGLESCKKVAKEVITPKTIDVNVGGQMETKPPVIINDACVKEGYTNKLSFNPGETIKAFINAKEVVDANIGIYDSSGNLKDYISGTFIPQKEGPEAYKNGYQYSEFVTFTIPANFKSGLYFISKKIPFIVKNPNRTSKIIAVLATNTDNAYNEYGGLSSYSVPVFSPVLSFQRPYELKHWSAKFWPWAETLAYDIDYITDADLDDYSNFSYGKVLILPGHNEYWTRKARLNFDRFVSQGRHALVLSGNTMWWQVRYSDDGSQMICYKGLNDPEKDPEMRTFNWFQKQLKYPIESSIGMTFDLGGYGNQADEGWDGFKIVNQNSPILENTGLRNGDIISCYSVEYDGAPVKYVQGNPHPVIDNIYGFHKIEMIGYDYGFRLVKTVGTFIAMQKTPTSGIIINTASTDWCSKYGMGGKDGDKIKQITINALNLLLEDKNVFTS